MEKLSVVSFSRNDVGRAVSFAQYIQNIADDIVLIDSSSEKGWKLLVRQKQRLGLTKLRIFHAVALGCLEPYLGYAYGKCKNDWVIRMDSDERLSPELAKDIKKIISQAKFNCFAIKRYEEVRGGEKTKFFTWQQHLSRKSKTLWKGIVHEQPEITGQVCRLEDERYFIQHIAELKNFTSGNEYGRMEKFNRYSYRLYREMMLEHFSKAVGMGSREAGLTTMGKLISWLLSASQKLRLRGYGDEIGDFDYLLFYSLRESAFMVKQGAYARVLDFIPGGIRILRKVRGWKDEEDGKEVFEISKIIHTKGLIQFLGLDDEEVMRGLANKYKGKKQGIGLLMSLLMERYRETHRGN